MTDIIKALLKLIPEHIKDSSDFTKEIQKHKWEESDYFGSLDVAYLYRSIPLVGPNNVIDIASDFFEKNKVYTEAKDLSKNDFKTLINLCALSDKIIIDNKIHKQKTGLAMGNNLSPMLAIIYMHHIEEQIIKQSQNRISIWLRYIDEIFFISKLKPEELLNLANTISRDIQFTLEKPLNNKIRFLDKLTELTTDKILNTCLYIKPFHSRHIIPWSSNTTMQLKIWVIKSEQLMALRLSLNK